MNYKDLRLLVIGLDYLDLAREAHSQGATVYLLANQFPRGLHPDYPTFNLVRDDIDSWGEDWLPFKPIAKRNQIDIVVSNQINKAGYFAKIALKLLTDSWNVTSLRKYYRGYTKVGNMLLWL